MKNRFIISEEEKNRILGMHQDVTKKRYLAEQKNDYDAIVGKTAYFTIKEISDITDGKDTWTSDFNELDEPLTDNDRRTIRFWSEQDEYGKIESVKLFYVGTKTIHVTITSNMNIPTLVIPSSSREVVFTYTCNSGVFTTERTFKNSTDTDSWLKDKRMLVDYTNEKLSTYLDSIMPCSKDAFDFAKSGGNEVPNNFA
jgi:hypothetical protein